MNEAIIIIHSSTESSVVRLGCRSHLEKHQTSNTAVYLFGIVRILRILMDFLHWQMTSSSLTTAGLFALAVSTVSAFVPHPAGGGAAVRARDSFSTSSPRAAVAVAGSSARGELRLGNAQLCTGAAVPMTALLYSRMALWCYFCFAIV